mmetsp:Transcript_27877/g.64772  ORF Transcript_27877/g.64772 Transcript_27877/m.64772 type:complete len:187 (+) Transcript_27877:103-663(+)
MATSMERINNIYSSKSPSWSNAEEEKKGRASIHESQCRRYSAAMSNALSEHMVSKEDQDADRVAAQRKRQQQESELQELFTSQKEAAIEAPKPVVPAFMVGSASKEPKTSKLPGFVAVKKAKTSQATSSEAEADSSGSLAKTTAEAGKEDAAPAAASTGIGLGAYGSSSEEEDDEDESKPLPAASL